MKGTYRTITSGGLDFLRKKKTEPKAPSRCEWGYGGSFDKNRHLKFSVFLSGWLAQNAFLVKKNKKQKRACPPPLPAHPPPGRLVLVQSSAFTRARSARCLLPAVDVVQVQCRRVVEGGAAEVDPEVAPQGNGGVLDHEPLLPVARCDRLADGQRARGPLQKQQLGGGRPEARRPDQGVRSWRRGSRGPTWRSWYPNPPSTTLRILTSLLPPPLPPRPPLRPEPQAPDPPSPLSLLPLLPLLTLLSLSEVECWDVPSPPRASPQCRHPRPRPLLGRPCSAGKLSRGLGRGPRPRRGGAPPLPLVPDEPKPEPHTVEGQAHHPLAAPRAPLEAPKRRRRVAIALAAAAPAPLAPRRPRRAPRLARVGVIVTPPALPARPRRRRLHLPASAPPAFRSLRFARNSAAASSRSVSASASASAMDTNSRMIRRTEFLVRSVSGTLASLRAAVHSTPLSRSRAAFTWLGLATWTILLSTWRREARTEAV